MAHEINNLKDKKIVCLGGGIGTVNLIRGLKNYTNTITVVVSMADEGGSSGRLRRLYNVMPSGDLISCMSALMDDDKEDLKKMLKYRFPGDRYDQDHVLGGHKLGNLMMVAAQEVTGSYTKAINLLMNLFQTKGRIYPATTERITLNAVTSDGANIKGEENIDLGKYNGERILEKVFIDPKNPRVSDEIIQSINDADIIIAGPGDLYTTVLPVLIIPTIKNLVLASTASKVYVVNVANKPFETKGYTVQRFISAIGKHLQAFPFQKVITNNNYIFPIPEQYHYSFVKNEQNSGTEKNFQTTIVASDLVDEQFPLYHDAKKLALAVNNNI